MTNITISIPQETKERLDLEENKSALITRLLNEHYKYNLNKTEDCDIQLNQLEERKKQMLELIEKEREKIVEIKSHVVEHEINETKLKELREEKQRQLRINIASNFKDITGREITTDELDNAIKQYNDDENFTLFSFIKECNANLNVKD